MSGETLRRAAALIRAHAEAVDTTPAANEHISFTWAEQITFMVKDPDAAHLTTFGNPAVALAVADWLGACATRRFATSDTRIEHDPEEQDWYLPALAVANAYLGATP